MDVQRIMRECIWVKAHDWPNNKCNESCLQKECSVVCNLGTMQRLYHEPFRFISTFNLSGPALGPHFHNLN
jgi:hypothetical protein